MILSPDLDPPRQEKLKDSVGQTLSAGVLLHPDSNRTGLLFGRSVTQQKWNGHFGDLAGNHCVPESLVRATSFNLSLQCLFFLVYQVMFSKMLVAFRHNFAASGFG